MKNIIELDYTLDRKVSMFDCHWVSQGKRIKEDEDGFTIVNFSNLKPHNEPFILASEAKQAFYVTNHDDKEWHIDVVWKARDVYDMDSIDMVNMHLKSDICNVCTTNWVNENLNWTREGIPGFVVEAWLTFDISLE